MNLIVKLKFGSHIYGTNTPKSDIDIKSVYLPPARDILLKTVRDSINIQSKDDKHSKNSAGDTDSEVFSLQRYLNLLTEGQTNALDMLFTPPNFYLMEPEPLWIFIQENKERFVHAGSSAFAGYCKTQANRYSLKGTRLATVRGAIKLVEAMIDGAELYDRLADFQVSIEEYNDGKEFASLVDCKGPKEGTWVKHWEVCNRKIPLHATLKYTRERLKAVVDEYGDRAKKAEQNDGSDWKALSHAVRVCEEAKELMSTGKITFPRPEVELLLRIKNGGDLQTETERKALFEFTSELIETGLVELEEITAKSTLRKHPDREFADNLVTCAHADVVKREFGQKPLLYQNGKIMGLGL